MSRSGWTLVTLVAASMTATIVIAVIRLYARVFTG